MVAREVARRGRSFAAGKQESLPQDQSLEVERFEGPGGRTSRNGAFAQKLRRRMRGKGAKLKGGRRPLRREQPGNNLGSMRNWMSKASQEKSPWKKATKKVKKEENPN